MIGTGVFTSMGYQLIDIQSTFSLMMLWIIGGIISLSGVLCYAELSTALPRSGGEYHLLSYSLHPSIGFAAGIVSATVGFTAPAVVSAILLGEYISRMYPMFDQASVTFVVITGLHLIHMSTVRSGLRFQDSFTAIKIFIIMVFIVFGFFIDKPQSISLLPSVGDLNIILSSSFATNLVWVLYAYTGWNSVIYISGEIKNPKLNISKAMLFSTCFVMILYVLLNYVFLYTTPINLMEGKPDFAYIVGAEIFGEIGAELIGLSIAVILLSTISSYVYIGPRIIQIMGEDHEIIKFFKLKNNKQIPINAFGFQLCLAYLFIFTSRLEQIVVCTSISLIITTTLTIITLFVLRIKEPKLYRPYKVWGYPFTPSIFLIINFYILYNTFADKTIESLIGIAIFLAGVLLHFFSSKPNKI